MSNLPQTRKNDLVVQKLNDETLIYDLKINKAYCLNETSTLVWDLCDGTNSVSDIAKSVGQKLDKAVSDDFVWLALDQLKADNLLENNDEFAVDFNGLSRRQVIRKVGLASMVLLPLVSSLVAPTAAMAQSGGSSRAFLAACSSPGQCSSGNCVGSPGSPVCCVAGATRNFSPGTTIRALGMINSCASYPTSDSVIAAIPSPSANCCSNSTVGSCSDLGGGFILLQVSCA